MSRHTTFTSGQRSARHSALHPEWLRPAWQRSDVAALMTTRAGGTSRGPWASLNLGSATGDDPAHVDQNRAILQLAIGVETNFIRQVHGVNVVECGAGTAIRATGMTTGGTGPAGSTGQTGLIRSAYAESRPGIAGSKPDEPATADACFTTERGVACTVLAADCLPLLFAAPGGRGVAAAHAGWRGLAAGVIEATLLRLCEAAGCSPGEVDVWLGACIGPGHFEVGRDVLDAFGVNPVLREYPGAAGNANASANADPNADSSADSNADSCAHARFRPCAPGKWLADLPGLARDALGRAGVVSVTGGSWCTVSDPARFFSYRRDGVTGRMAASIHITGR